MTERDVSYREDFVGDTPEVPAVKPAPIQTYVDLPASPEVIAAREFQNRALSTVHPTNMVQPLSPVELSKDYAEHSGMTVRSPFDVITDGHDRFDPKDL